jgi:hypothetical protein
VNDLPEKRNPAKIAFFAIVGGLVMVVLLGVAVVGASAWVLYLLQ